MTFNKTCQQFISISHQIDSTVYRLLHVKRQLSNELFISYSSLSPVIHIGHGDMCVSVTFFSFNILFRHYLHFRFLHMSIIYGNFPVRPIRHDYIVFSALYSTGAITMIQFFLSRRNDNAEPIVRFIYRWKPIFHCIFIISFVRLHTNVILLILIFLFQRRNAINWPGTGVAVPQNDLGMDFDISRIHNWWVSLQNHSKIRK